MVEASKAEARWFMCAIKHPRTYALTLYRPIVAVWFLSFVIRGLCAIWFSGMIEIDGAEYARIAQNLLAGVGYVGLAAPGEELLFPPLFPFLVSAVTLLTHDAEVAGRIISVFVGSLVVVPVYLIAQRMYSQRVAVGAAVLAGAHPFLIEYSATALCESTYLTIILMSIYMAMRSMDNFTLTSLFLTGGLYGVAYLVRSEALPYMLVASCLIALWVMFDGSKPLSSVCRRLPMLILGFCLLAGPYIGWLSVQAGQFVMEGKTPYNLPTERLMAQGLSSYEAQFRLDPDMTKRGVAWQSGRDAIRNYNIKISEMPSFLSKRAKTVFVAASATISGSLALGSPTLFGLAILGLFSRPWTARFGIDQIHLMTILALVPFAVLFTHADLIRFYIIFVPVYCIWGAYGIVLLFKWARESTELSGLCHGYEGMVASAAAALTVGAILLPAGWVALGHLSAARSERQFKQALVDLSVRQATPVRMASNSAVPAFEARAEQVWLPYCDEKTARRFLAQSGVKYVVLGDWYVSTPYQSKWMDEGVPEARQIVSLSTVAGSRLKIFELEN